MMPYLYLLNGAPTFQPPGGGGNWTVNNLTVTGNETVGGTLIVSSSTSIGGNLTVSGTGTSSVAGKLAVGRSSMVGSVAMTVVGASNANLQVDAAGGGLSGISLYAATDADAYSALQLDGNKVYINSRSGGNLLIGTTTDSSNGKLQLATHTTSAGGIGFGTDVSLYRSGAGGLALDGGSDTYLDLRNSGTTGLLIEVQGSNAYVWGRAGKSLKLYSNDTLALTLDSSQNATFAGTVAVGKTVTAAGQIGYSAGNGIEIWGKGGSSYDFYVYNNGGSGVLRVPHATQNVEVVGSIAIGNTVTAAVSVASTHKVTISIGGVTYYLLASNV